MKVEIDIEDNLTAELKAYEREVEKQVRQLIDDLITKTEIEATISAPKFVSIDKKFEDKGLTGIVGVIGRQVADMGKSDPNNLAAYVEFGTGLSAKEILEPYPDWVKEIAWKYYVSGRGTLKGQPYLFNNFLKNHAVFERELKQLIEKYNL